MYPSGYGYPSEESGELEYASVYSALINLLGREGAVYWY